VVKVLVSTTGPIVVNDLSLHVLHFVVLGFMLSMMSDPNLGAHVRDLCCILWVV